jgi:hypothetical protein
MARTRIYFGIAITFIGVHDGFVYADRFDQPRNYHADDWTWIERRVRGQ